MLPRFTAKIVSVSYFPAQQRDCVLIEFISEEEHSPNLTAQQQAVSSGIQMMIQVIPLPLPLTERGFLRMSLMLTDEEYFALPIQPTVGDYFDFSFNEKGALLIQPETTPEGRTL
jgi:hypothetical protein